MDADGAFAGPAGGTAAYSPTGSWISSASDDEHVQSAKHAGLDASDDGFDDVNNPADRTLNLAAGANTPNGRKAGQHQDRTSNRT
jgi:hypothetical protein